MITDQLVFEVGVEELPSAALEYAIDQLPLLAEDLFDEARLSYERIESFGSPRRLVLRVSELALHQADRTLEVKGPAARIAFDAEGAPTRAAEGFARANGVELSSLVVRTDVSGEYVYACIEQRGRPATDVLPALLAAMAGRIEWQKTMRWGNGETRFPRPVRWMLALLGSEVIPVEFASVRAGRLTQGHRFLAPGPHAVSDAASYEETLIDEGCVIADGSARAECIRTEVGDLVQEHGLEAVVSSTVFEEVVNLVEWPTIALGAFDESFLDAPREVLESAMQSHQRYFPTTDGAGNLSNRFVVVHNGASALTDSIVAGHERVIRARLSDAVFFYRDDRERPLSHFVDQLGRIVFQENLGTLKDKAERVKRLTARIAELSGASPVVTHGAVRAAALAKADLASRVVVEFPALQGIMGAHYALVQGEGEIVADAIREHYKPRFAADTLPVTAAGRLVSVADRLDTICGIFVAGLAPTGSADPYALRRAAIGVLHIVIEGLNLTLDELILAALEGYEGTLSFDSATIAGQVREFFVGRLEGIMRDRGHAYDSISAVLAVASGEPADALARVVALTKVRASSDVMEDLSTAYLRARNLSHPEFGVDTDRALMRDEEARLDEALTRVTVETEVLLKRREYLHALTVMASLRTPVDTFFESVLVMDPDEALRANRLKLLNRFVALFSRFADFSRLAG